jgi:hypothetical protein
VLNSRAKSLYLAHNAKLWPRSPDFGARRTLADIGNGNRAKAPGIGCEVLGARGVEAHKRSSVRFGLSLSSGVNPELSGVAVPFSSYEVSIHLSMVSLPCDKWGGDAK